MFVCLSLHVSPLTYLNKNSPGDEIANVNFFTITSYMQRPAPMPIRLSNLYKASTLHTYPPNRVLTWTRPSNPLRSTKDAQMEFPVPSQDGVWEGLCPQKKNHLKMVYFGAFFSRPMYLNFKLSTAILNCRQKFQHVNRWPFQDPSMEAASFVHDQQLLLP